MTIATAGVDKFEQIVADGTPITSFDGLDVYLRGDGWCAEHYRIIPAKDDVRVLRKYGPYQTAGDARLIEQAYRRKWGQA
jgi:hypothetical protein